MSYQLIVNGKEPLGPYTEPMHKMLRDHVVSMWTIGAPAKSINPPYDFTNKIRFAPHDYDGFSTYFCMVIQDDDTRFDNEMKGQGTIQVHDPVLFELTARRLKYGKTFEELDNARREIHRILAQYKPGDIPGLYELEVFEPGDILPLTKWIFKLPRSLWRAQIKCMAHYHLTYVIPP